MEGERLIGAIILGIVSVLFFIMTGVLLKGKGAFLVAGYNTMPKSEKAKYDTVALCKFVGKVLLGIDALLVVFFVGIFILGFEWVGFIFGGGVLALCVFAVVYSSAKNRFKK